MPQSVQRSRISSAHVHFLTVRARSVAAGVTFQLEIIHYMAEVSHGGVDQSAESFSKFKRYIILFYLSNFHY